jgi:hypothetical protein
MPNKILFVIFKIIKNKLLFGIKLNDKYNILKNKKMIYFMKGYYCFTKRML